eukprot:TRINITY_DN3362_c0_g1_i1.p1 TRINITY_DN3362_c0_g1~~TRINITY_DN3362_c0_g1_i1.p1  ORF type:complete len:468 (-),score=109.65 TRINITY_DN3362_c0_g1_i1:61-1464(-)
MSSSRQLLNRVFKRAFSTSTSSSSSSKFPFLSGQPPTRITTLPNGFRVATEEGTGETATVGVWIDSGSVYEDDKTNGTAHFLEHMAFKGTKKRSQEQIEREIEDMGGHLNAFTTREHTVYFARSFRSDVPKTVDILSDILQNSSLTDKTIEAERSTILTEMETVNSNAEEVIFDHLHSAAYQGFSLGQTILGPKKNIESLTRKDMTDFISQNYTAGRMVLVGSGAVNHEELVELAKSAFSGLPSKSNVTRDRIASQFTGSQVIIRNDDLPLAHIALAVEGVGWTDPEFFTLQLIQILLGSWDHTMGGMNNLSSALSETIANEGLAHSYSTFMTCYHNTGIFGNYYVTTDRKVEDLTYEILKAWQTIAHNVSESEVERAKTKLQAAVLMNLDGSSQIAEDIGRQLISIGRRVPAAEIYARISDINTSDVRRVARHYLTDISPAIAAIGPLDTLPDYNQIRGWTYWNRL